MRRFYGLFLQSVLLLGTDCRLATADHWPNVERRGMWGSNSRGMGCVHATWRVGEVLCANAPLRSPRGLHPLTQLPAPERRLAVGIRCEAVPLAGDCIGIL